ncbi:MAG: hypothetical protein ACJ8F4_06365 [Sphingomonas sp.]
MKRLSKQPKGRQLGRVSIDTRGAGGPDLEMIGLWHKPGFAR